MRGPGEVITMHDDDYASPAAMVVVMMIGWRLLIDVLQRGLLFDWGE